MDYDTWLEVECTDCYIDDPPEDWEEDHGEPEDYSDRTLEDYEEPY